MTDSDKWGAGDPAKWSDHGTVKVGAREYPLIWGEHAHSRSDNQHYVTGMGKEPVGFDGHRILLGVQVEESNYLKDSHYSGDEIRKGGSAKILADGEVVYEFFHRDARRALLKAHHLIGELLDHSSSWLNKKDRERLVGRLIYYDGTPAAIQRLIVDQGCVIIATEDGKPFPPPVWAEPGDDERESSVKVEVLSPQIWWHREMKANAEGAQRP